MTTKERRQLSNMIMEEVMDLRISKYQTIFLANMVLERIEHPRRKMDEIASSVMQIMPQKCAKPIVQTSSTKCLEALEEELHNCDALEGLVDETGNSFFNGKIVRNVVLYFAEKVLEEV